MDITKGEAKTYLSDEDFRGRTIRGWCSYYDAPGGSLPADANVKPWKQYFTAINNAIITNRVGKSYVGVDVMLAWMTVNTGPDGGNVQLWIDGASGRLFVDTLTGGFGSRFQAELVIEGGIQKDSPDITI